MDKNMDKKFSFTQARIRDLQPPKKGRVDYYDLKIPRLTCRVSSTGNKSFVLLKWNGTTMQRVTIGKYADITVPEAQKKAIEILTDINSGINPTAEKRRKEKAGTTLHAMLERYIDDKDLKAGTIKDYRYKLKLGFEAWLDWPISKITKDDVLARFKIITREKGDTTANNTMRVLRLTLNYACNLEMINENPAGIISKTKQWHRNKRKKRIISSDDLQAWHNAVEELPSQRAKVYLLMALYMGYRSEELLTLEWSRSKTLEYSYIDIKSNTVSLFDPKNHIDHILPIPRFILAHIKTLKNQTGGDRWVFSGRNPDKPMDQPRAQIRSVIRTTGIKFSPHDCRRTFATISEAVGLPTTMIKRLLNHVTTNDVTGGYIVTEEETLRIAINKIADFIQEKLEAKI